MSIPLHLCVAVQVWRQAAFRSLVTDEHWPPDIGDLYRHTYIIMYMHDIKVSMILGHVHDERVNSKLKSSLHNSALRPYIEELAFLTQPLLGGNLFRTGVVSSEMKPF